MYSEISTVINFAKNQNNRRPHKKKKSETGKRGSEVGKESAKRLEQVTTVMFLLHIFS